MDDSHHARLETELVGRFPAHQRDDPERSGLQLDLCHNAVVLDPGDDAAQTVPGRGGRGVAWLGRLGQLLSERGQLAALDRHPPVLLDGIQPALFDPASYGVIADSEQGGRLADPQIRHRRQFVAADAASHCGTSSGWQRHTAAGSRRSSSGRATWAGARPEAITALVNELCALVRPHSDDLVDAFGVPGAVVDVSRVVPSQHE
jgi:hypothetical protein